MLEHETLYSIYMCKVCVHVDMIEKMQMHSQQSYTSPYKKKIGHNKIGIR